MNDKHYIVDKFTCEECQRHFYKKGYRWSLRFGKNISYNPFNPFKEDDIYFDDIKDEGKFIINISHNSKTIGWDFYDDVIYFISSEIYPSRKEKLKRIINN